MTIEDNVTDSDLQKMWKQRHVIMESTKTKMRSVVREWFGDAPDCVKERREEIARQKKIEQDVGKSSSILRTLGNMLKFGAKDLRD
jgi:hypothetical protein